MAAELATSREALMKAARRAEAEGSRESAIQRWQEARATFPNLPEVYLESAAHLRRLDRLGEAIDVLREGLKRFPDDQ